MTLLPQHLLISPEIISLRVHEIALELDREYQGKELLVIGVLKGSIFLISDLLRALSTPTQLEFVRARSYGPRGAQRGELTLEGLDALDITSKDVLLVDDIFDSGETLRGILARLQEKKPSSLKSLVLLSKKVPRAHAILPDFVLFEVENLFVVGYGLDYKEHYRGLPGIFACPV